MQRIPALVAYFTTLLNNPVVSDLAPQIPWKLLNPTTPGRPASPGVAAKPPDVSACEAQSPQMRRRLQQELNLASQKLLSIAGAASTSELIFPFDRLP